MSLPSAIPLPGVQALSTPKQTGPHNGGKRVPSVTQEQPYAKGLPSFWNPAIGQSAVKETILKV